MARGDNDINAQTGVEALAPGPRSSASRRPSSSRVPSSGAAYLATAAVRASPAGTWACLASSERRGEEIARAAAALAPDIEVIAIPLWDCLPYDRASPSRDVMGRRVRSLGRLLEPPSRPRLVVMAPGALLQRGPPPEVLRSASFEVRVGDTLDRAALSTFGERTGYVADDRIDEPGEIALLGEVADVFPPTAAEPIRIIVGQGDRIEAIRTYDPVSQRTVGEVDRTVLWAASEYVAPEDEPAERAPGIEHGMAGLYPSLASVFDYLPKARVWKDEGFDSRLDEAFEALEEARETQAAFGGRELPPPGLYLSTGEVAAGLKRWTTHRQRVRGLKSATNFAAERNPGRAFCDAVAARRETGRVVLTGLGHELRALRRALARGLDLTPTDVSDWQAVQAAPDGAVVAFEADLEAGFFDPEARLWVAAAADVLGGRLAARTGPRSDLLATELDFRVGDVVVHEDHGVGVLRDLALVEIDGEPRDALRIAYSDNASVLAPVSEISKVWRYGADAGGVRLDRLGGEAWPRRRAEANAQVAQAAAELTALANARLALRCEPLVPPPPAYARFCARFGYPETPDQASAIAAVLADLASGRPMDRLVCGDVGFGKTEVALRAAAAVALAGRQVVIAAPTTVLARQHAQTFERRFRGTGVTIAHVSRLEGAKGLAAAREAARSGEARIIVGTHAVASDGAEYPDLSLVIIDEEQKFGADLKAQLRALARDGHCLTMTATPIPRTLQAARIGLQTVSVIASPPARRRPVRTFVAPMDAASIRTALLREKRRGGQSFVVTPRIQDIPDWTARLEMLVPELDVRIAHGGLADEAVDAAMVGFAEGQGDVLLATNIIESGLDVPQANTIIVWRPDRFGLAQLHQLRGRVGRGRAQGVAYLLSAPDEELSPSTRARLSTLEAFDRLGAGLAISAQDLDQRGGGDLTGDVQAGHVRLVGADLYQRLLDQAVRQAKGEALDDAVVPDIRIDAQGAIPEPYVPDAVVRINLYARLARLETLEALDEFEAEILDRFGEPPLPVATLLGEARLRVLAQAAGVLAVTAGPKAIALSLRAGRLKTARTALRRRGQAFEESGGRLLIPTPPDAPSRLLPALERILGDLAAVGRLSGPERRRAGTARTA